MLQFSSGGAWPVITSVAPQLPKKAWLLQLGVLINFFGNGLVAPFLLIYLYYGRHIPTALAGSAIGLGGVTAIGFMLGLSLGGLILGVAPLILPALAGAACLLAAFGTRFVDVVLSPEQPQTPLRTAA